MRPETEAALKQVNEAASLREQVDALNARIDSLEGKLTSMSDKVDSAKIGVENLMTFQKPQDTSVPSQPTESIGVAVEPSTALTDPEAGMVNDASIQAYRQAMILFKSKKYPEAILAFSSFIERYADHPLAGSAQFYVGESYFRQKEYKLAVAEFDRVLTSYDRSSSVADTLKQIALAEEHLRLSEDALKHRQLLLSLFPQSPAAKSVELAQSGLDPATPDAAQSHPMGEAPAPEAGASVGTAAPASTLDEVPPTAPIPTAVTAEPRSP
jgi:TolA-binding protein